MTVCAICGKEIVEGLASRVAYTLIYEGHDSGLDELCRNCTAEFMKWRRERQDRCEDLCPMCHTPMGRHNNGYYCSVCNPHRMADDLKPCPFCGGEPYIAKRRMEIGDTEAVYYGVGCKKCRVQFSCSNVDLTDASNEWNKRISEEEKE